MMMKWIMDGLGVVIRVGCGRGYVQIRKSADTCFKTNGKNLTDY